MEKSARFFGLTLFFRMLGLLILVYANLGVLRVASWAGDTEVVLWCRDNACRLSQILRRWE